MYENKEDLALNNLQNINQPTKPYGSCKLFLFYKKQTSLIFCFDL